MCSRSHNRTLGSGSTQGRNLLRAPSRAKLMRLLKSSPKKEATLHSSKRAAVSLTNALRYRTSDCNQWRNGIKRLLTWSLEINYNVGRLDLSRRRARPPRRANQKRTSETEQPVTVGCIRAYSEGAHQASWLTDSAP